jgi:hypothetical protein
MERHSRPSYQLRTFSETDYRFGTGPLRMTVEAVDWSNPVEYGGETWYEVVGIEQTTDGRALGRRSALVKASQLSGLPGTRRP